MLLKEGEKEEGEKDKEEEEEEKAKRIASVQIASVKLRVYEGGLSGVVRSSSKPRQRGYSSRDRGFSGRGQSRGDSVRSRRNGGITTIHEVRETNSAIRKVHGCAIFGFGLGISICKLMLALILGLELNQLFERYMGKELTFILFVHGCGTFGFELVDGNIKLRFWILNI